MKKVSLKLETYCNHENLTKYLPARYVTLVSKSYYGETVNLICFSIDKSVITSGDVIKAQKRIANTEIRTFYFARCFTIEAAELISESNGIAFYQQDFPWFDESYNRIRNENR